MSLNPVAVIINRVHKYYFDKFIKKKELETKNILIDQKNSKDLLIYFTRYIHTKLIKILILYYYELKEAIEENGGKKYLMVDGHILDKVLNKIK